MSFGSIVFTTRGKVLQSKAQAGTKLNFTKMVMGDGELGSQSVLELTDLINKKLDINISNLKVLTGGIASVGGTFTNQGIDTGFYWRELGLYATDPDLGEILYCYGNAGALAEYIPASGGSQILEKFVAIETIIGNAENVSATINGSLVYATIDDIQAHNIDPTAHPEILEQITVCNEEIEKVRGEIETAVGGIDLSSVNAHTTNVAETIIKPHVTQQSSEVISQIGNHANGLHTVTNNHVTNTGNSVNDNTNARATEIKNHVTNQTNSLSGAFNSTRAKTWIPSDNVKYTYTMNLRATPSSWINEYFFFGYMYVPEKARVRIKTSAFQIKPTNKSGGASITIGHMSGACPNPIPPIGTSFRDNYSPMNFYNNIKVDQPNLNVVVTVPASSYDQDLGVRGSNTFDHGYTGLQLATHYSYSDMDTRITVQICYDEVYV